METIRTTRNLLPNAHDGEYIVLLNEVQIGFVWKHRETSHVMAGRLSIGKTAKTVWRFRLLGEREQAFLRNRSKSLATEELVERFKRGLSK